MPPAALRGLSPGGLSCRGLSLNENTYYVEIHVLVCTIKMKKSKKIKKNSDTFLFTPGYQRKKLRTAA